MQNPADYDCVLRNVIKNEMFPYRIFTVAISDIIAANAKSVVVCKYMEGCIHLCQIVIALFDPPCLLSVLGNTLQVGISFIGQLEIHLAVQVFHNIFEGVVRKTAFFPLA